MEQCKIYSPNNKLLLDTLVDDNSYHLTEIMGANSLMINFSLNEFIPITEGSYTDFKTERFWMPRSVEYVKESSEKFNYTLQLEGAINFFKSTKFKFFDFIIDQGRIKATSSFKLKFPFTATPRMVADLVITNLRLKYPQYPWAVGDCIESEPIVLDYNHHFCFDVLADVANKFKTEWELDKFTLSFAKVEKMKESAIDLSYGYDNGILGGLRRMQYDNTRIINRVYIESSDRNIDHLTYGNDTLLLPKNKIITHKGIDYTTDASGSYLERVNPLAGEEDSLDLTKFYPKRIGTVSAIEVINDSQGFYNIIDNSIPVDLDFSKRIIAGENMTIIFQTGQLAGKEFDVKYIHDKRKFELVPINNNGLIYPQGNIIPAVGDKYAVFHMRMPDSYISDAENEALQETVKYLWEGEQPQYSYRWQLDGNYAKRNWGAIRGFLNIGYFVRFSDLQFLPDAVDVRIVTVKEPYNDPQSPEITIANNVSSQTIGSIINEIPSVEQSIDRKDQEVREYAKRRWKDTQELIDNIMGMTDEFKENLLSALVFEGMIFRAGAASLQFRFLADDWNTSVEPDIYFDKANKKIHAPAAKIKHESIEINGVKPYWVAPAYISDNLTQTTTPYYLYLKCSRDLAVVGGRLTGEAIYFISDQKIKLEDIEGFYVFWVAFINSENEEKDRSFSTMYGLAELLPGQLTVDTIRSSDGGSYWKALKNQFKLPGFDWNVSAKNTITIAGFINAVAAQLGGFSIDNEKLQSLAKDANGNPNILLNGVTGEAKITGRFESNSNGKRIIIDPVLRSIQMRDLNDNLLSEYTFDSQDGNNGSKIVFNGAYNNKNTSITMTNERINITNEDNQILIQPSGINLFGNGKTSFFNNDILAVSASEVVWENIPENNTMLGKSRMWVDDSGYLRLKK